MCVCVYVCIFVCVCVCVSAHVSECVSVCVDGLSLNMEIALNNWINSLNLQPLHLI